MIIHPGPPPCRCTSPEMLSPNPTSGEFGGSSPPPSRAPWMYHLRVKHQSHLAPPLDRAAFGQSCTSPCSSDVPAPAGRGSSGVHDGAVACFCCCLVLCAAPTCSLDASRFTGGWELGPARLNRSLFPLPPCSSVASQSAGRELGQGGIGPLLRPLSCPPLCVRSSRAARATPTAHKGVHHITSVYISVAMLTKNAPKMLSKCTPFPPSGRTELCRFLCFVLFFLCFLGDLAVTHFL